MKDTQRALACANAYRRRGLSPLPSRMDRKGPALATFAEHYQGVPVPDAVYEPDNWRTTNIQVITGAGHSGPTKIAVVDLDGDEAAETWARMCRKHDYRIRSAWVARTGSGGTHIYYALPEGTTSCQGGMLWGIWDTFGEDGKGQWAKHKEIRLLADNGLVIAPPSIHVETNERYAFLPGLGPNEIPVPEVVPAWVLAMPRLSAPRLQDAPGATPKRLGPVKWSGRFHERGAVLAAIHDKVELARSWGLVTAGGPNVNGWVSCYVPWRESPEAGSTPSGSMHAEDGTFQDRKDDSAISLFDLGAILQPGRFMSWVMCRDWCGDHYIGSKSGR